MNHVAMLRVGNEIDWIEELMEEHIKHFSSIYFLSDSDDGTGDIVRSFKQVIWSKTVDELARELGDDGTWQNREWCRQPVLELIIDEWGEGTWVTFLHGDELFYHCPLQVAQRAEYFGQDNTIFNPIHFFLHTSQKEEWESKWAKRPLLERLRWYCPGDSQKEWAGAECKQIRVSKDLHWVVGQKRKVQPEGLGATNPPPYPLYLHLGYRSPEQAMRRVERNIETGFQWEHRGLMDGGPFLDCLDGLSEVIEYTGSFGNRERPDLYTYKECKHQESMIHG